MPDPLHCWVPPHEETYGDLAAGVGEQLGMPMDDEQKMILDAICAEDEPGVPTCFEVGVVGPEAEPEDSDARDRCHHGPVLAGGASARLDGAPVPARSEVFRAHGRADRLQRGLPRSVRLAASGVSRRGVELLTGEKIEFHARSKGGPPSGPHDTTRSARKAYNHRHRQLCSQRSPPRPGRCLRARTHGRVGRCQHHGSTRREGVGATRWRRSDRSPALSRSTNLSRSASSA